MLEFQDISIHFGSQEVLRNVQLRINPGEHVGIVGPNGAGKSTLFGLVTGEISPYRGKCVVPNGHRIGYVRQHLPDAASQTPLVDFACEGVPELVNMEQRIHKIEHDLHAVDGEERERLLRRLGELQSDFEHLGGYDIRSRAEATLCGLGFHAEALHDPLQSFSGGWRMRAELARALRRQPAMAAIPIIAVTGVFDSRVTQRVYGAGIDLLLAKPFRPDQVVGEVRRLLSVASAHETGEERP